jgi:hypothetical protein
MAESIGLIERAAALLRQQDAFEPDALPHPHPVAEADARPAAPELILWHTPLHDPIMLLSRRAVSPQ